MAIVSINENYLTDIANAIREKNGTSSAYKPKDMAAAINEIEASSEIVGDYAYVIPGTLEEIPPYMFARGHFTYPSVSTNGQRMNDIWSSYLNRLTYAYNRAGDDEDGSGMDLNKIGYQAFYGQYLKHIDIPASVTEIDPKAFEGCSTCYTEANPLTIICRGTTLYDSTTFDLRRETSFTDRESIIVKLYVPEAIYTEAVNHYTSTYNQLEVRKIEDYPEICAR